MRSLEYVPERVMELTPNTCLMLHDATIRIIEVNLLEGTVSLSLRLCDTGTPAATLMAKAFVDIKIDRLLPWGPSNSINLVEVIGPEDHSKWLKIQMQSGDNIIVKAAGFELHRHDREDEASPKGEKM